MRLFLCICILLLMAAQPYAETYSWVDADGVWNYSDDFYSIPQKYRKKAKRTADEVSVPAELDAAPVEKIGLTDPKPASAADTQQQLYNGKTREAWRAEFDLHEAELKRLEVRLEELRNTLNAKPSQIPRERQTEMYKEYEDLRVEYNGKYSAYSELIESARKAGLVVEIRK